jgi:hypothetical protein
VTTEQTQTQSNTKAQLKKQRTYAICEVPSGWSGVTGRTVREGQADDPRVKGVWSANQPRTSSMHPPKFGQSESSLRTVRDPRTVWPLQEDGPANSLQTKPTDPTDQNETAQELAKNSTNTWSVDTSRTVRRPAQTVCQAQK